MKNIISFISALTVILMLSSVVIANEIMVHDAWVRSAPPNAKVLAAYMVIMNKSEEARKLTAVSSPKFKKGEMHKTEMHDGMMKMIPQKQLNVPARGVLNLEPGGYHLMLIKPDSVPQEGEHVNLELHFDNGKVINVSAPVRKGHNTHEHHQYDDN